MRKYLLLLSAALLTMTGRAAVTSVDDLAGIYNDAYDYACIWNTWSTWDMTSYTGDVTIAKTGDNTISIYNLSGSGLTFNATVDLTAGTITIPAQKVWTYYTANALPEEVTYGALYADPCDETAAIVGTIGEDGTITINWAASYYSCVVMTSKNVLVKNDNIQLEWSRMGTLSWVDQTGDEDVVYQQGTAILEKWAGKDFQYQLTEYSSIANPSTVQFNVTDEGYVELLNGWYSSDGGAFFYYLINDADDAWLQGGDLSFYKENEEGIELSIDYEYFISYNDNDATSAGILQFLWNEEIETAVQTTKTTKSSDYYDLQGRKVERPAKGLYIRDGKVVLRN